jgi:Zn-dependent protease
VSFATILQSILQLVAVLPAVAFHEVAHGYIAHRLGDPTAKSRGRLTLNPLAHIDPIGSILVPFFLVLVRSPYLFGWAKPVPVNPRYFRNPLKGMLYVAIAGPMTNLVLALVAAGAGRLMLIGIPDSLLFLSDSFLAFVVRLILFLLGAFVIINVVLAVFNLLPIPPLDGSRILTYFLPPAGRRFMLTMEQYGFIILIAILLLGGLSGLFHLTSELWRSLLGSRWYGAIG